jgi:predicted acyltransferase
MNDLAQKPLRTRLISLDAFRGITIAGMILVNNPGSWNHVFPPLRHARWNGCTPTDLVFPFFLFIVGVSIAFSFRRRLEQGYSRAALLVQVVRRTLILLALGLAMNGFPDLRLIAPYLLAIIGIALLAASKPPEGLSPASRAGARRLTGAVILAAGAVWFALDFGYFQQSGLRVPGVLQRIAVCYFLAAVIALWTGTAGRCLAVVAVLVGYWLIVHYVSPPEGYTAAVTGSEGLLHDWVDTRVLAGHLYTERPDPEGILSTLPAVGTVLLGLLTGSWLQTARSGGGKVAWLFFTANILLLLGLCWNAVLPINKKIWTGSYVLWTGGLAMHFLAMCYWLIDVCGRRRWAWPFVVFGSNAIFVYVASSFAARALVMIKLSGADGAGIGLKTWLYQTYFASWADPQTASLFYALAYVALWLLPMILLYRLRVFIKI